MPRTISFDLRVGGGSSLEVLYGEVSLTPTAMHSNGTSMVLPGPTTYQIVDGLATALNVQETPTGDNPAWLYHVLIKSYMGRAWSFIVGVPTGTGTVAFADLPHYSAPDDSVPAHVWTDVLAQMQQLTQAAEDAAGLVGAPAGAAVDAALGPGGAARATLESAIVGRYEVSAREFGITGTGDETTKLQTFINYLAVNGKVGVLPDKEYHITAPLVVPVRPEWALRGAGSGSTKIIQDTDNVAVINLGGTVAGISSSALHTYRIEHLSLGYKNAQPASNTNATGILVSSMPFEGTWRDIKFINGYYGSKVASGIGAPWGHTFDDLVFASGLTGGAFDWRTAVNGVPNNRFGRMFVDALNMTNTIFHVRGYNFTIDTIEVIQANQGPTLFHLAAGAKVVIGSMKLENGVYTANQNLFNFDVNAVASIGNLNIGGDTMSVTAGTLYAVRAGAGAHVTIGCLDVDVNLSGSGVCYSVIAGTNSRVKVGKLLESGVTGSLNNGSSDTAEWVTFEEHVNNRLSGNKPDADYTVALGDPNIIHFGTALTAPRKVTLPVAGNSMTNGLYYEIVISGAVNGANTLTVYGGTTVLRAQTTDKVVLRYTYRRNAAPLNGWVLTKYEALP